MRPAGTEDWTEEQLQSCVTRDSMVGVAWPKSAEQVRPSQLCKQARSPAMQAETCSSQQLWPRVHHSAAFPELTHPMHCSPDLDLWLAEPGKHDPLLGT